MSDYRFGDDYKLNYDHEHQNAGDDYDHVDWNTVKWVEIDGAMFVMERTCHMVPVSLYDEEGVDGIECDECGWSDVHEWYDTMPKFCPNCGAKVAAE